MTCRPGASTTGPADSSFPVCVKTLAPSASITSRLKGLKAAKDVGRRPASAASGSSPRLGASGRGGAPPMLVSAARPPARTASQVPPAWRSRPPKTPGAISVGSSLGRLRNSSRLAASRTGSSLPGSRRSRIVHTQRRAYRRRGAASNVSPSIVVTVAVRAAVIVTAAMIVVALIVVVAGVERTRGALSCALEHVVQLDLAFAMEPPLDQGIQPCEAALGDAREAALAPRRRGGCERQAGGEGGRWR